jgi:hypothetical protein
MVEPKDVVLGILGASGALAGLLLVFGGFIFSQAASSNQELLIPFLGCAVDARPDYEHDE